MVKVRRVHLLLMVCEKGKPVVRRGRKATGLLKEAAGLSNRRKKEGVGVDGGHLGV
jgi:hypothetical protein